MATANPIEDHITCSICLEIYQDPYILKECMHTFCRLCIKKLEKRNRIQCPECRVCTNIKNMKKDFKLQGVIDSFQAQQKQDEITIESIIDAFQNQKHLLGVVVNSSCDVNHIVCEWCCEVRNPVTSYCLQCEKYFCKECVRRHSRVQACMSHRLQRVEEMTKTSGQEFKALIEKMTAAKTRIERKILLSDKSMHEIGENEKQQLEDVIRQTDDAILQLKENRQLITDIIKDVDGNVLEGLKQGKATLLQSKEQLEAYITNFSANIAKAQPLPPGMRANINACVESDLEKINIDVSALNCEITSPIQLKRNSSWNVKDMFKIDMTGNIDINNVTKESASDINQTKEDNNQIRNTAGTSTRTNQSDCNEMRNDGQIINPGAPTAAGSHIRLENNAISDVDNSTQVAKPRYSQLHMYKYDSIRSSLILKPGLSPRLLRKVNDEIWCCNEDNLLILDLDINLKRVLKFYPVSLSGFTLTHVESVVLSCLFKQHGLLQVNKVDGKYLNQIAEGCFSDVCCHNNQLYALEQHQSKILVFSHNQHWSQVRELSLDYQQVDLWDSLCVNHTGIYVTSWANKTIYAYSLECLLKYQIRKPTNNLVVCDVDDAGNLLCVDYYKRQVKLYTSEGLWHDVDVQVSMNNWAYPMYVLYGDKQELWVTLKTFGYVNHMEKYCLSETCL